MATAISEIISRSEQGITRPFLCRAADGQFYYVKGNFAGRKALCAEWIAARLGQHFDLPIPSFAQISVPVDWVRFSARDDIADLGPGLAFGSQKIDHTDELRLPLVETIDGKLRAKILLFDWWICNSDRTLTEAGGNPNLLWFEREHKVFVIDHNLALEENEMASFWGGHIFRRSASVWNAAFQSEMTPILEAALSDLPNIWREMPAEWTEIEVGLTLERVTSLLSRFVGDPSTFWRTS